MSLPNLDCTGTCSVALARGPIDLEAKALPGAAFTAWSGCANASGAACHVNLTGDLSVTATFDTCPAVPSEAVHYVDAASGTDSIANGGGPGACAFRTMSFALAHSSGTVRVASGTYPTAAEKLPLLLQGKQGIQCPLDGSGVFTGVDKYAGPPGIFSLSGTSNFVTGCTFQGSTWGGTAILVASSAPVLTPHRIEECHFVDTFYADIDVSPQISNVRIERNAFVGSYVGVWTGLGAANVTLTGNTFAGTTRADVYCTNAVVIGAANTHTGGPIVCEACPSCPG